MSLHRVFASVTSDKARQLAEAGLSQLFAESPETSLKPAMLPQDKPRADGHSTAQVASALRSAAGISDPRAAEAPGISAVGSY